MLGGNLEMNWHPIQGGVVINTPNHFKETQDKYHLIQVKTLAQLFKGQLALTLG